MEKKNFIAIESTTFWVWVQNNRSYNHTQSDKEQLENLKVEGEVTDPNNWFVYMSKRNEYKLSLTENELRSCEEDAWGLNNLTTAVKRIQASRRDAITQIVTDSMMQDKEK